MSVLIHTAATVVATPLPSPQVIKETFTNTVPVQVPADLTSLAQNLGLMVAAAFVSLVHQLMVREKLSGNVQRAIVAGYTLLGAVAFSALTGHLGTSVNDLNVEITSFVVALGAALGRYEYLWKAFVSALGIGSTSTAAPVADPTAGEIG